MGFKWGQYAKESKKAKYWQGIKNIKNYEAEALHDKYVKSEEDQNKKYHKLLTEKGYKEGYYPTSVEDNEPYLKGGYKYEPPKNMSQILSEATPKQQKEIDYNKKKNISQILGEGTEKKKTPLLQYKTDIDLQYKKVSDYTPDVKVVKWNPKGVNTSPLSGMEKFSNQFLGVFGDIKNLKKPKTVWAVQDDTWQDPVSGEQKESVWESVVQLDVIAEDKTFYYARDEDGKVTSFKKKNCVTELPSAEEQATRFKAAKIRNSKKTADMMDKFSYNVSQGVKSTVLSGEGAYVKTGNKALDIASEYGGQALGFFAPSGAGAGTLFGKTTEVSEKAIAKAGQVLAGTGKNFATRVAERISTGVGKAALTGATDMAQFSLLGAEAPTPTEFATNVTAGAILGGAVSKIGSVVGSKLIKKQMAESGEMAPEIIDSITKEVKVKIKSLQGKYKLKNTELEKAMAEWEEAVFTVQNHFKQKELTVAEQNAIETELGISTDKLLANLERAEKEGARLNPDLNPRLRRVAGVYKKGEAEKLAKIKEAIPEIVPGKNVIKKETPGKIVPSKNVVANKNNTILANNKIVPSNKKVAELQGLQDNLKLAIKENKLSKINSIKQEIDKLANKKIGASNKDYLDLQLFGIGDTTPNQVDKSREIIGHIVSGGTKKTIGQKIKAGWEGFYKHMVDVNNPIAKFTKEAEKLEGKKLIAGENPIKLANISGQSEGIAKNALDNGVTNQVGHKVSKSLKEIVKGTKGQQAEMEAYAVAKHAIDWMDPAKKMGTDELSAEVKKVFPKDITLDELKSFVKIYETKPGFKETQKDLVNFSRSTLKNMLVDSGLVSKKAYLEMVGKYPNYVPLQRSFEEAAKTTGGVGKGQYVNVSSQIKKAKGSERQVISPIASIIKNTFNYAKAMKNNEVGQAVLKQVLKHPEELKGFAEVVEKFDDTTWENALKAGNLDKMVEEFNQAFEPVKVGKLGANDVNIKLNGASYKLRIHDVDLLKSLANLNKGNADTAISVLRGITNRMKSLTTGADPFFALLRNPVKDLPTSFVLSKTTSKIPIYNAVKYMFDLTGAAIDIIGRRAGFQEYRGMGGGFFSSMVSSENLAERALAKYIEKPITPGKVIKSPLKLLDLVADVSNIIETTPRYNEYKQTVKQLVKKGVDEYAAKQEGLYNAAEITVNFRRHGDAAKTIDAVIPYFNAAVQGIDRFARAAKSNPKELANMTSKAITMITLPTMFAYAINRGDKAYNRLSQFTKDNNFMLPLPGTKDEFIKIPKPREFGFMFSTLPERLMDSILEKNPKAYDKLVETISYAFLPPGIMDTIISPITRNRSEQGETWQGNPVVPQRLLDLPAHLQYDKKTSGIAKIAASALNYLGIEYSPMKLDDIVKSYTGILGKLTIPATSDEAMKEKGFLGAMVDVFKYQAASDSKYSTDIPDTFYTNMKKVTNDKAVAQLEGKLKGAKETYLDRASYIFGQAAKEISDLRDQQRNAKTNEEKDRIQEKMLKVYQRTNKDYENFYKKKQNMKSIERQRDFVRPGTSTKKKSTTKKSKDTGMSRWQ